MIKLVVADMDGTSLGANESISTKNVETILKVLDSGREFAFASGRPTFGMKNLIKNAGLEKKIRYFIAYNGGTVCDTQLNKNIYAKNLNFDIIKKIYNLIIENNFDISFCLHEKNLIYISRDTSELEMEVESNKQTKVFIKNIDELKNTEFMKILLVGKRKNLEKAREEIKKSNVSPYVKIMFSLDQLLEIIPFDSDKCVALKWFSEHLGIPLQEILTIGDGENDIEMLKMAGFSAAMNNAYDSVKKNADYVTKSPNTEDGLTEAIKHFIKL